MNVIIKVTSLFVVSAVNICTFFSANTIAAVFERNIRWPF